GAIIARRRTELPFSDCDFARIKSVGSDLEKGFIEGGPLIAIQGATLENSVACDNGQRFGFQGDGPATCIFFSRWRHGPAGQSRIAAVHCEINGAASWASELNSKSILDRPALLVQRR